jgi:pilus assembly protein CpaE
MLSDISSLLLINNFNNVIGHPLDFFALQDDSILRGAATVIIDIGSCNDVTLICETATLLIPASARQVFLGRNDSIAFAQALMSAGVCYLHIQSQLAQLAGQLQQPDSALATRSMMKISLLGCKGGRVPRPWPGSCFRPSVCRPRSPRCWCRAPAAAGILI